MSFITYAEHSQDLKSLIRNSPQWENMYDDEREVLESIASNLAHLVTDNPHNQNDWFNIKNFAQMICDKEKNKWDAQHVKDVDTTNLKTTDKVSAGMMAQR